MLWLWNAAKNIQKTKDLNISNTRREYFRKKAFLFRLRLGNMKRGRRVWNNFI